MSYCVNCGVELDKTCSVCPLCNTKYDRFISEDVTPGRMGDEQDYKKYMMEIVMSDADVLAI